MRKAIIDLGTNTFNLLIADVRENNFEVLHAEKDGVALGMGGINDRRITKAAEHRALVALSNFKTVCDSFRVDRIWAFGTSALRDAENADDFVKKVKQDLDLEIAIISGEQEAQLIFEGVSRLHDFRTSGVVIDIGGGSTEVIFADENGVSEKASLDIGVSRIYQQFNFSDPFCLNDTLKIEEFLDNSSNSFLDCRKTPVMIGSSGSFETFYELLHQTCFPDDKKIFEVDRYEFEKILNQVIGSTLRERELNEFIIPIRKIMAPITAVKIKWLMKKLGTERVLISPFSLKEGAMFNESL
jgi:exopolyphosphatase/guanosine-5'-triphosphate,3'-diphosphate pyrophosphatase